MTESGDRLARTRLAIIELMQASDRGRPRSKDASATDPAAQAAATHGRWAGLRAAGRDYWSNHPARMVIELAIPAVTAYAQKHPAHLVALSAAAGALLVLARPWRLLSVTGLVLAALRSPQLSSMVLSALTTSGHERRENEFPQPARSTP